VVCLSAKVATVYHPRQPRQSPLYKPIERHFPEFQQTYKQSFQDRYGHWRPIVGEVVRRFLAYGDLHFGFARIRCKDCHYEMFVPFSCRQRCLCPSCHQKRTLLAADTISHAICQAVLHRQLVFTIPKRLRPYFRHDRSLLGHLACAAWETVSQVYCEVLDREDILPDIGHSGDHSDRRTSIIKPPLDRSAMKGAKSDRTGPRAGSLSTWAMLITRIFEVDPLKYSLCYHLFFKLILRTVLQACCMVSKPCTIRVIRGFQ
jgi:Transposase zinc-binding domain